MSPTPTGEGGIVLLLGKPARAGTIFPRLVELLRARGLEVRLDLPHEAGLRPDRWPPGALVAHRGLRRDVLEGLAEIEGEGWRFCNAPRAALLVRDRPLLMDRLARHGLPAPAGRVVEAWPEARALSGSGREVVIKAADGGRGRSAGVLLPAAGSLPADAPFPGPYLVEPFVANDGWDRKLYVAGQACRGLLKPWPRDPATAPVPFEVEPALAALALAAGAALGLEIYGVDVLIGAGGPTIVDVNPFPSFQGTEGAAELVAGHLVRRAAPSA